MMRKKCECGSLWCDSRVFRYSVIVAIIGANWRFLMWLLSGAHVSF